MHDMDNDQVFVRGGIIDRVILVEMDAQSGCKLVAGRSNLGVLEKRFKSFSDLINERGCVVWRILCDIGPDFRQIIFRLFSYPKC